MTFAAFLVLGLPDGALGPAWPSIRAAVGRPPSDLAWLISLGTIAYLLSSASSGHLAERRGAGSIAAGAALIAAAGSVLFAVGPVWVAVVAGAVLVGLGGGVIDPTMNAYLALRHGPRAMNTAHGVYGIGATLGPLAVGATLSSGFPWQGVYAAIAGIQLSVAAGLAVHRRRIAASSGPVEGEHVGRGSRTLVAWLLATFFFYVGAETSVGAWTFSLLTEHRGVGETAAAVAVGGFWAGLTLGRLGLGGLGHRVPPRRLLRGSVLVVAIAVAALWADPFAGAALGALPLIGLAMAGVFPTLVYLTPRWLGSRRTRRIVGYQLAASSAGAIVAAWLIGAMVRASGLAAVGAGIAVVTGGLVVSYFMLERRAGWLG